MSDSTRRTDRGAPPPASSADAAEGAASSPAPDAAPKSAADHVAAEAAEAAAEAEEQAESLADEAQKAAEAAEDEGEPRARRCPHCRQRMTRHGGDNPFKAGAWHCDGCGCCWRGMRLREGHSACSAALAAEA